MNVRIVKIVILNTLKTNQKILIMRIKGKKIMEAKMIQKQDN